MDWSLTGTSGNTPDKGGGSVLQNGGDAVTRRRARERRDPSDHFVEHYAQAPNVRARVRRLPARLLGRHVLCGAQLLSPVAFDVASLFRSHESLIAGCSLGEFGNPEVKHLRIPVRPQHDVLWFDVAMHDAGFRARPPAPKQLERQFPARRADSFAHARATLAALYLQ